MWRPEYVATEKSEAVKAAEARITAEERAMTQDEREARYQRLAAKADASHIYRR